MKIQKSYSTIDVHVAGEAFRIIKDIPFISYRNLGDLYERFPRAFAEEINLLLNEPRGFAGLNGCLVVPPINQEADAGVVFFNHQGTVPLHYGGIIAVITALLECGQLKARPSNQYKLETLNGIIPVTALVEEHEVVSVEVKSDPSRVIESDLTIPSLNINFSFVQADQFYAVFKQDDCDMRIEPEALSDLKRWGQNIFRYLHSEFSVDGAIIVDDSNIEDGRVKSITFRDDGFIVRSPGFGSTIAIYTNLLSKKSINLNQHFVNESIFGSKLKAQVTDQSVDSFEFTFTSHGFITGMQTFLLDPTDPLAAGFLLK
ncbi:proline racemase family protein [Bacillus salipaludis]|uniref:proline racemase family protein n=1 Tax=Bacillus salipaludis TaxID=2547811 RepID=UPI002E1FAB72|nr:proline racemase family protein [Bacillus salipaludis]